MVDNWPFNLTDFVIVIVSDVIFIIERQAPQIFNVTVSGGVVEWWRGSVVEWWSGGVALL